MDKLTQLKQEAVRLGATDAVIIRSRDIWAVEELAELCNGEYVCPNYGRAASCPPHVEGPDHFRKWQDQSQYAVIVKIELPSSTLFSDDRNDVMRLLHTVVAGIEKKAVDLGYPKSRAFAGGSCKSLFCKDYETCSEIDDRQPCRFKNDARPSMSGFGIDVVKLMESSGWSSKKAELNPSDDDISWVAGLVLIAE